MTSTVVTAYLGSSVNEMPRVNFTNQTMGRALDMEVKEGNLKGVLKLLSSDDFYAISEDNLGSSLREACERQHYLIANAILECRAPGKIAGYDLGQALLSLPDEDNALPTIQKIVSAPNFERVLPETVQKAFIKSVAALSFSITHYFLGQEIVMKSVPPKKKIQAIHILIDKRCKELFLELLPAAFSKTPEESEHLKTIFFRLVELEDLDMLNIFSSLQEEVIHTHIGGAVCLALHKKKALFLKHYSSPIIFSELPDNELANIAAVAAQCNCLSTFDDVINSSNFARIYESNLLFKKIDPEASTDLLDSMIEAPFNDPKANQVLGILCIAMAEHGEFFIHTNRLFRIPPFDFFKAIKLAVTHNHTEVANTLVYSAPFQGLLAVEEIRTVLNEPDSEGRVLSIASLIFKDVPIILNIFRDLKRAIDEKQTKTAETLIFSPIFQSVSTLPDVKIQVETALKEDRLRDVGVLIAGQFLLELPILSQAWKPINGFIKKNESPVLSVLQHISTLQPTDKEFATGVDFDHLQNNGAIVVEQIKKRMLPEEDQVKIRGAIEEGRMNDVIGVVASHTLSEMLIPREVRDLIGQTVAMGHLPEALSVISLLPISGISVPQYEEVIALACEQSEENTRVIKALINPSKEKRKYLPQFSKVSEVFIGHCFQKICELGKCEAFKVFLEAGKLYDLPDPLVKRCFFLIAQNRTSIPLLHAFIESPLFDQIQSEDIVKLFEDTIKARAQRESPLDVLLQNPYCLPKVKPEDLGAILTAISEQEQLVSAFILRPEFPQTPTDVVERIFFDPLINLGKPVASEKEDLETKPQFEQFKQFALTPAAMRVFDELPYRHPDYFDRLFVKEHELEYLLIAATGMGFAILAGAILDRRANKISLETLKYAAFQAAMGPFLNRFVPIDSKTFISIPYRIIPKEMKNAPESKQSPILIRKRELNNYEFTIDEHKIQIMEKILENNQFRRMDKHVIGRILCRASMYGRTPIVWRLIKSASWDKVTDQSLEEARNQAANPDIKEILNNEINKRAPLASLIHGRT